MAETLRHRGPDAGDVWQDEDVALLLAHRRLSIIDLSEEGRQPMASASGRYIIVYNGEIYNFPALQRELEDTGMRFRGRSDTEIFLAAVESWGLNRALQKINGMFAFALWDRQQKILHLARDRMGKKPLYVGWAGHHTLIFGSELKAFNAHPDFTPVIAPSALGLYLRFSHVPAPQTIYQGVWQVPPGFRLDIDLKTIAPAQNLEPLMHPYWHALRALEEARGKAPAVQSDTEAIDTLEELLSICVRDRMLSDVPLGAFLSGGIDSSAVVALMQKNSSRPVKTYTIGFEETGFNEAAHAKAVAAHIGTDHHELILRPDDTLSIIPHLADMYDEPFADISAIPTYLVSHFARQDVTVALSGDGGDEMLGGYRRHAEAPRLWNMTHWIPGLLRAGLGNALQCLPPEQWDRLFPARPQIGSAVFKVAAAMGAESEAAFYKTIVSSWSKPPMRQEPSNGILPFFERPDWQPNGLGLAEKMMYWDAISYLPGTILTKVDRASMAASLEARAPLLDRRIYDFVWGLPLSMKIRSGEGKWLLRQVLARHVPKTLFERPKQGFSIPVATWLRGPLKDWAEDLLSDTALSDSGLLDPRPIRAAWNAHLQGRGGQAEKLWTVLMFQAWHRRWA